MSKRAGRKRKAGIRTASGQLSRAGLPKWDYGNDRVQQRREAFRVYQGGKADEQVNDCIGRVWAAGLLDGTEFDPAVLRDIGRDYGGLYWDYYHTFDGVSSYEPRSRTSGTGDADPRGERFKILDRKARAAGYDCTSAMHSICVNEYWFPDGNPAWVQRLLNECWLRQGKLVVGYLADKWDKERLQRVKECLVAMVS